MAFVLGHIDWGLTSDKEGHRDYSVVWLVAVADADGPQSASFALGLPQIGEPWLIGNDYDPWAFCLPSWTIRPVITKERSDLFTVEQTFSTRPLKRCQDSAIEDPLLEPYKISGSFMTRRKRIAKDRNGDLIKNGAHQQLKIEVDKSYPTVSITANTAANLLSVFAPMINTLNASELWGLEPRRIKLAGASWQRVLFGTCSYYYTTTLDFEVDDSEEGGLFDVEAANIGNMCLLGHCPGTLFRDSNGAPILLDPEAEDSEGYPNKDNPKWFEAYRDRSGAICEVPLKPDGTPLGPLDDPEPIIVEHCTESEFGLLGIPPTI